MRWLEGHRVIEMRRVGHAGLACALTMVALLVPHAGRASADLRGRAISVAASASSTSARPVDTRSGRTRFISYGGVRVTVPQAWPVIDLRVNPQTCVRFDRPVVYLGPSGSQSGCPAHAVGRGDTIWLKVLSAGPKDPLTPHAAKAGGTAAPGGVDPVGHDKQTQFVPEGVELEATWGADSSSIDQVLASAVSSSGSLAQTPSASSAASAAASAAASNTSSAAVQPVAFTTATSASTASSTFTGMAFDTCAAPSVSVMRSWLASPYRAAGIYIGGSMRACADGNLSSTWVAQVRSMGWGLLPIYVGAQAPCVKQSGLATISASQVADQGTAAADDAISRAQLFGLGSGTPIYYDMEAYNSAVAGCSQTVMTFISAWTGELHRLGYTSGAYGSSGSLMVDMSRATGSAGFLAPDDVWFAHWNQLQTTSDSGSYPAFPDTSWSHHQRLHQYSGGFKQSWGGASVNIDASWVDASVSGAAVPVDYGTNVVGPGGTGFVFTGSMAYWRPAAPAGLKALAYWTYSHGSTEANGATWSPQLSPGVYDVEANIAPTNAPANAPYTITDALGSTTKVVNQASISGYTSLGTFTAQAGSSISVHVGDNDPSSTTTQISVDAIAFRLVTAAPPPFKFTRVAGSDRYGTSANSAKMFGSSTDVILASGDNGHYADALTASYLAGIKGAPILLTQRGSTPDAIASQIAASGAKNLWIIGGDGVVSTAQETALKSRYAVHRLAGTDRYQTAAAVITAGGTAKSTTAILATGQNFPDALGGGALSYARGMPLAITQTDNLPISTLHALQAVGIKNVILLGGPTIVTQKVVDALASGGISVLTRLAGADRAATSALLAEYEITQGFLNTGVNVASGYALGGGADALGGAALSGKQNRPLLITDSDVWVGPAVEAFLTRNAKSLAGGDIFGGMGAVSAAIEATMTADARALG